jgi:undecaprenyl-diphosphatase
MVTAWTASVLRREHYRDSRLAWQLLVATIPVGLVGLLFDDYIEAHLRNPLFVAGTLVLRHHHVPMSLTATVAAPRELI